MKRLCGIAITVFLAVFATTSVSAADIPPATIAVLDYQAVLRNCAAGQQIRDQIEAYRSEFHSEIAGEEEKLKQIEQSLQQQRTILSPQAYEEKRRQFERDVIDMQRRAQDRSHQLERALNAGLSQIHEAIIPIVQKLTRKLGFNVVVDKTQVLFARKQLDITEQVLKELDATLPRVEVPKPGK